MLKFFSVNLDFETVFLLWRCVQDCSGSYRHTVEHAGGDTQWRSAVWGAGLAQVAVRRLVQRRHAGKQHGGGRRTRVSDYAKPRFALRMQSVMALQTADRRSHSPYIRMKCFPAPPLPTGNKCFQEQYFFLQISLFFTVSNGELWTIRDLGLGKNLRVKSTVVAAN